jgi:hypothetical protein
VWYARDERARDREVLHLQRGVLYKSGVYAWNALCLTPGGLQRVPQGLSNCLGCQGADMMFMPLLWSMGSDV